jgi:hypothetical protein
MLPAEKIQDQSKKWINCIMADPMYHTPGQIDIILGADVFHSIIKDGIQKGSPTAINSELGWLITGPVQDTRTNYAVAMVPYSDLNNQVKRFW